MQCFLVDLSLVFPLYLYTSQWLLCMKKIQVTRRIFHGVLLDNIAHLVQSVYTKGILKRCFGHIRGSRNCA